MIAALFLRLNSPRGSGTPLDRPGVFALKKGVALVVGLAGDALRALRVLRGRFPQRGDTLRFTMRVSYLRR